MCVRVCVCACKGQFLAWRQNSTEGVLEQMFWKRSTLHNLFFSKQSGRSWSLITACPSQINVITRCPLLAFSSHCCTDEDDAVSCECTEGSDHADALFLNNQVTLNWSISFARRCASLKTVWINTLNFITGFCVSQEFLPLMHLMHWTLRNVLSCTSFSAVVSNEETM